MDQELLNLQGEFNKLMKERQRDDFDEKDLFKNIGNFLSFLERNLNFSNKDGCLEVVLNIINILVQREVGNVNIEPYFERMLLLKEDNEIQSTLQFLFQILKSLDMARGENLYDSIISKSIMETLIMKMFEESIQKSDSLMSKAMICLQTYIRLFKSEEIFLMEFLWHQLKINKKRRIWPILVNFIDDLVENNILMDIVFYDILAELLNSYLSEERRVSFYLMNRVLSNFGVSILRLNFVTENEWLSITGVLENIETNQTHLILPALETFEKLHSCKVAEDHNLLHQWYCIIFNKLFKSTNILVKRWLTSFAFQYLDWDYLCENNMCCDFLNILNTTKMYTGFVSKSEKCGVFDIDVFNEVQLKRFFKTCFNKTIEFNILLNKFAVNNWKPIPFIFWMTKFQQFKCKEVLIEFSNLLSFAACVRKLQNLMIRKLCIDVIVDMFSETLKDLNLIEFTRFIEVCCNSQDDFVPSLSILFDHHMGKFERSDVVDISFPTNFFFSKNICRIIDIGSLFAIPNGKIMTFLETLDKKNYGYLIFNLIYFSLKTPEFKMMVIEKLQQKFAVNFLNLLACKQLEDFQNRFLENMKINDYMDAYLIKTEGTNFFILENIHNYSDLMELEWNLFDFLENINKNIMDRFVDIALSLIYSNASEEKIILFVNKIDFINIGQVKYFFQQFNQSIDHWSYKIINIIYYKIIQFFLPTLKFVEFQNNEYCKHFINYVISIEPRDCGERKAETEYLNWQHQKDLEYETVRFVFSIHPKYDYPELVNSVFNKFLELNKKKPRYFNDSNEHVIFTRLINFLYYLEEQKILQWDNNLWDILLNQNHQPNVTICLEYLIAKLIPSDSKLNEKFDFFSDLSSSQQLSLISVKFFYLILKSEARDMNRANLKNEIFSFLPFTMGSNFSIRLYSQLYFYYLCLNILQEDEQDNFLDICKSIEIASNGKLLILLNDIRLILAKIDKTLPVQNVVHYCTKAPVTEYSLVILQNQFGLKTLLRTKELFETKLLKTAMNQFSSPKQTQIEDRLEILNLNLQRKNQNIDKILVPHNLIFVSKNDDFGSAYNSSNTLYNDDVYIVGSLINKFANLGGIARSCEVLGIKNFVVNSMKVVENVEFKTVSLTAEKHLNIIEVKKQDLKKFLIEKQFLGYKIVGAEQVSNSKNFNGFQFPKKTVLILGNEKEGISANLLCHLDYTIEIPQLGNVRSLNVHVTAALFIWEYCKQHMLKD